MDVPVPGSGAVRRTLVFVGAVFALLGFARSGAVWVTLMPPFALFLATATIWLRGQYVDGLDGLQWTVPRPWCSGLLLAAAVMISGFWWGGHGGWGLAGVIVVYLVAGSAVTGLRQRPGGAGRAFSPRRAGPWLAGGALVLALGGFAVLGREPGAAVRYVNLGVLAFCLLVVLPVGVALSAEGAIRRLSRDGAGAARWRWTTLGGGLVLGAGSMAVAAVSSRWLVLALAVLAVLAAVVASATQADVVLVLAVLALMGGTPWQDPEPDFLRVAGGQRVLVAFGDSYLSGEGGSIYYAGTDDGGGNQCRRSPSAWAALAAQQAPFDRLYFRACSGAQTANVRLPRAAPAGGPEPWAQPGEGATQLAAYRADRARAAFTPRLVVLSVGGNDAGFSTIGVMCLAPGNCADRAELWQGAVEQLRPQLRATYREVAATFPDTPVVVIPYPEPFRRTAECGQVSLSTGERAFVHRFLVGDRTRAGLNRVIEETAQEYGFHYLAEMQQALAKAHLQLCDPLNGGRPGLNFVGLRSVRGIAEQRFNPMNWSHGSLHPNERGHAALLRTFQGWLAERTDLPVRLPLPAQAAARRALAEDQAGGGPTTLSVAGPAAPQCDLLADSPRGCRSQGRLWTLRQVGRFLLTGVPLALAAGLGGGAVTVAGFAWRRRHYRRRLGGPYRETGL